MSDRRLAVVVVMVAVLGVAFVRVAGQERRISSGAPTGIAGLLSPADATTFPKTPWGDPAPEGKGWRCIISKWDGQGSWSTVKRNSPLYVATYPK